MTLDIEQIKARAEAATPGPWSHFQTLSGEAYVGEANDDDAPLASMHQGIDEQDRNAAFIAHARTDIPLLLEEVARLQAENERLTFVYLADAKISGALVADNERLRAELAERERQIEALGKARLDGLASGGEVGE